MQENFSILLAKLENFGFLKRRIKRWEGFFFLLILIVAFLLIGSFLQGFLYTILMVVFFTGILAISIVFIFLPFFKRPSYEEVALYIERKTSGARNRIINALQLGRTVSSLDTGEKLSPLVPLIVKDAVKFISTVDFTEIISKERLLFAARIATGLSILLSVFYFAFPEKVKENFLRLRRPFDTYSYLTKYTIEVTPGDYTVLEGEPLSIEAYLRGDKVPPTLKLLYRGNGMESSTYMKFNKDHFTYTFGEVWQPFTYRVQGSIVSSQWYRVDIEEKLKVTAFTFYYQHPAYTSLGHREEQNTTGAIKAPVGTKVKFRAQCNKKLSEAWLILPSGERSPLLLTAPQVVAGELTVSESGTYQLELIDTRSRKSEISSSITAVADVPPSIRIVEPGKNVEYEEGRIAPLMVSVEGYDDYGIREMSVKYRRFTPPPQRPRLLSEKRFGWDSAPRNTVEREAEDSSPQGSTLNTLEKWTFEPPVKEKIVGEIWDLTTMNLKSGDSVIFWAEIKDNDDLAGGKVTESKKFKIRILSAEEAADKTVESQEKAILALAAIIKYQKETRDTSVNLAQMGKRGKEFESGIQQVIEKQNFTREESLKFASGEECFQPFRVRERVREIANGLMVEAIKSLSRKELKESIGIQNKIIQALEILQREAEIAREASEGDTYSTEELKQLVELWEEIYEDLSRFLKEQEDADEKEEEQIVEEVGDLKESELAEQLLQRKSELDRLPDIDLPDPELIEQFNQIYSDIQKASEELIPEKPIEMKVSEEEVDLELAEQLREDLEMWLPDIPDRLRWDLEQLSEDIEVPMAELPGELEDLVGELLEREEELLQDAEDVTSAYADSLSQAGWAVMDGPISNFSAKGKTGNVLPNINEITGRSGEGRAGPTSGELVQSKVQGLEGRKTPLRYTPDVPMEGEVEELKSSSPGGATGGGKTSGRGGWGMPGEGTYPYLEELKMLEEEAQRIFLKTESITSQLEALGYPVEELKKSAQLMEERVELLNKKNLVDFKRKQRQIITSLKDARAVIGSETTLRKDLTLSMPSEIKDRYLKMRTEKLHPEYKDLLKSYFEALSSP